MISFRDNKVKLSVAFLVAGVILSGCASSGGDSAGEGSFEYVDREKGSKYTAEEGLTPRQRFTKALKNLENGEDGQALAELNAYLVAVPRSNSAKNIVAQITTDSSEYFPSEHFIINLTSGASLSTLAKKYLGSALKFYALAKYNNIANPSRVNIGQEIKIPLTQLARSQRDKDNALERETPSLDNPDSIANAEDVEDSVDVVAETSESPEAEPLLTEVIPVAPIETAESALRDLQELIQNSDYAAAIDKLTVLNTFGKLNEASTGLAVATYTGRAKEIAESDSILAAKYYVKAGQLNLQEERSFSAFENFKMATDLDDSNEQAMEEMLVLQKEIADNYHREASSAFRRQELDLAIENWDKVLNVDPDHSSAKLYRAQAIELKEKLQKLNQN